MDAVINLILVIHIMAFVAGGANGVAMPLIGRQIAIAAPDTQSVLFAIGNGLSQVGKVAMGALLVSGPLLILLRYGGIAGISPWFWGKMALIVVMLVTIVIGGINFKKAQRGVPGAAAIAETFGKVTGLAFLGVVICAVFAFG